MNVKIFSVYDSKAKAYRFPFFMSTTGEAIRAFTGLVNDGKSEVSKYPTDFSLFESGYFDDQNGIIVPVTDPINLGLADQFKEVL